MDKFRTLEGILAALNAAALLLLVWKLYREGLRQTYPALFQYASAFAGFTLVLLALPIHSNAYAVTYMVSETIYFVFSVLVVNELYRIALAPHPAIAAAGRRAIVFLLPTALVAALLTVGLDTEVLPKKSLILHRFFTVERIVDGAVVVFLVALAAIMLWFPLILRRNIVLYVIGFGVQYTGRTSGLLMLNLLPLEYRAVVGNIMMVITLGCVLLLVFKLEREKEAHTIVTGHRWNPEAMAHLSSQLDTINHTLARLVR